MKLAVPSWAPPEEWRSIQVGARQEGSRTRMFGCATVPEQFTSQFERLLVRSQAATDRKLPDGEVASPTETSSSETSAPVGGISLLNRGRRKNQPACEDSYCNNYTHFHERISLGSRRQRPPICLRA